MGLKVSTTAAELKRAVKAVWPSAQASVPELCAVRVRPSCGGAELSAYNFETSARALMAADCDGEGEAAAAARALYDAACSMPSGPCSLTWGGGPLVVECEGMRWELPALDPSQLPPLPELAGDGRDVEGIGALAAACDRFRSSDEDKPMLCCAALYPDGPGCVATDSYSIMAAGKCEGEMLLMPPAMAAAARSMESARVGGDGSVSWIEGGGVALTFRAVSGQYPPWRKVMAGGEPAARFPAASMAAAAKCAAAAMDRSGGACRLWADGAVRLEAKGKKASFDCTVGGSGEAPEVGFDPRRLADAMAAMEGEVSWTVGDRNRCAEFSDGLHRCVVMAMVLPQ